eukprot:comp21820_c0_seq1/m.31087 comp21820_c0_seq1/g.31087  ORF comp21820_c0_seq1/g.31087 comp21820_c0_seq1/m.31087 type:complete len:351 (-) comp21820_c0_seq1:232-1284(-)
MQSTMSALKRAKTKCLHRLSRQATQAFTLFVLVALGLVYLLGTGKTEVKPQNVVSLRPQRQEIGIPGRRGAERPHAEDVEEEHRERLWPYSAMDHVIGQRTGDGGKGKYLVVGIPTISRGNSSYLGTTLTSLLSNVPTQDREKVLLVVYVGDLDASVAENTVTQVKQNFSEAINSGLLEVIRAPDVSMYPTLTNLKRNFGDKPDRVYWRSKQCLDFSLLMAYCQSRGEYYMQLEDDVITIPDWMSEVRKVIDRLIDIGREWYMIDFSVLGFIGKTFHTSNMGDMVDFFARNYVEAPVDILLYQVLASHGNKRFVSKSSLFQHIGYYSSLKGKVQALKDPIFKGEKKEKDP